VNRRKAVTAISLAPIAAARAKKPGTAGKFIGVWSLVSCEYKDKTTGAVRYPYGNPPVGRITYDAEGRMSAQLMNPGRKRVGTPAGGGGGGATAARDGSPEDMREILNGFVAYYGTFDVDESSRTVIHHVQAALIPSWVGTDLRRGYEFAGNQLILTATTSQTAIRLVWQRDGK